MKITAAVLSQRGAPRPYAESRPLAIETLDLDPPGKGEVLVRIAAAGPCHSDLSVINGDRPRPVPMALGHEAAGHCQTNVVMPRDSRGKLTWQRHPRGDSHHG